MAAKGKKQTAKSKAGSKAKRAVKSAARRQKDVIERKIYFNFGRSLPVILILLVFAAAFIYGGYLESGVPEEQPQQIITNFIEKDAELAVHYIDVGQGDCSLAVYGDKTVLIDSGEKEYGEPVEKYIKELGITRLDYVIATHPHSDHIGSMYYIIDNFDIGTVIAPRISDEMTTTSKTYERFLSSLSAKGLRLTAAKPGDVYYLGADPQEDDTRMEILAPVGDDYDDLNDWSVAARIVCGETAFLFTGDAEKVAEEDIIASGADITADVLQVGHHGSSSSSCAAFLDAVSPTAAVISYGADNSYGHPHDKALERLQKRGIKIYGTAEYGNIAFYSDGSEIYCVTEKQSKNE